MMIGRSDEIARSPVAGVVEWCVNIEAIAYSKLVAVPGSHRTAPERQSQQHNAAAIDKSSLKGRVHFADSGFRPWHSLTPSGPVRHNCNTTLVAILGRFAPDVRNVFSCSYPVFGQSGKQSG